MTQHMWVYIKGKFGATRRFTHAGIATDKMRLLRGESTGITEQKISNHRWAEEELQKVMREFQLDREAALKMIREHAPTWGEMLQ